MTDRPVAVRKNPSTIAQIISALDDRNLGRAMRLLEPASESAAMTIVTPSSAWKPRTAQ